MKLVSGSSSISLGTNHLVSQFFAHGAELRIGKGTDIVCIFFLCLLTTFSQLKYLLKDIAESTLFWRKKTLHSWDCFLGGTSSHIDQGLSAEPRAQQLS